MKGKNNHISISGLFLLKIFIMGAVLAEMVILAGLVSNIFIEKTILSQKENWLWILRIYYFLVFLIICYDNKTRILTLIKSFRLDIIIIFIAGSFFVFSFNDLEDVLFRKWIESLSWMQLVILLSLPLLGFFSLVIRRLQIYLNTTNDSASSFMSDKALQSKEDDKFNYTDMAERFAERVFNQGSSESLVFGIDAPWGMGKSSFVNICKIYWEQNQKDKIIVYCFDPLRYEKKENLLEKFIDGLIKEIRQHVFVPEIESLVSRYAKLLKDSKASFSFLGISIGAPLVSETIDEVFSKLESALHSIDKKIVIVVDDLDRLDFSTVKEVLFVIKKAFTLPNISYVLCYDTENIAVLEKSNPDTEKIAEFLEKFINVKISLYIDNRLLLDYLTANKISSLSNNPLVNPQFVAKAVEGVKEIIDSKDFHRYLPFLSDARKIKRLINTILLLEVDKTDFDNCDFDKRDLIHLLLIYINYPNIFRKIYDTETQGKRGFFSAVSKYDDGYPPSENKSEKYQNSVYFKEYLKGLSEKQQFILNQVFNVNQRIGDKPTTEELRFYACFNGGLSGSGNLEEYLNLITKMSRPLKTDQYKFYINTKSRILHNDSIDRVLSEIEFSFGQSEINHQNLWRVLVNTSGREFTPAKAQEIIIYALNNIGKYSYLEIGNLLVGLRGDLTYYIAKLLDTVGWIGEGSKTAWNNTDENIIEIAKWIFGEGEHNEEGVIDTLGQEKRGITGFYDLMLFRLHCCADRNGDIFNLSKALSRYESSSAPTEGSVADIVVDEMRKMSQKVFLIFRQQYIDHKKNVFDEIDQLTISNVVGSYFSLIESKMKSGELKNIDKSLMVLKSSMKSFITYQLGNTRINNGIGCGYYDINGNQDGKEIYRTVNAYLFDICFNPDVKIDNFRHFIDYLLINLSSFEGRPTIEGFTKVLDKDSLKAYWKSHFRVIKSEAEKEDREVVTVNYTVTYSEYLENIYEILDELVGE